MPLRRTFWLWLGLGLVLVFLALNRHSRADRFNYHSEVFSDKAGYHIYLSAFEYDWNSKNFPDTALVSLSGYGFETNPEGKILTKYTYGTALAYSPFYMIGAFFESKDETYPGFSVLQNRMVSLAAAIYLLLGLYFSFVFLRYRYSVRTAGLTILVVLLGSNLLYYGVQETGMSHVYSFAIFAAFLVLLRKTKYLKEAGMGQVFLFGVLIGWMLMIRQLNAFFPLVYFFLDLEEETAWDRLKRLFQPRLLLFSGIGLVLLLIPQLLYWQYAFGTWVKYSYGEEGFIWSRPEMLKLWFSPYNGAILYVPLILMMLYGLSKTKAGERKNARLVLIYFVGLSYLFSCWWAWWFGCAFGARSLVEYYVLLMIGLAALLENFPSFSKSKRLLLSALIFLCCAYTFKMSFSVSPCFPGEKGWDWKGYVQEFKAPIR
ncbi:MAG: hypothetical protein LPK45_01275 [Bacteroidota bacterium]|nr:hypothetical protein [Bacteroidota bacterium]MDX5429666.1 hypothetical protein [Bacteroidota bacterium]MDX5468444.1 hypothetical protein [Bacteroidota bacterium]